MRFKQVAWLTFLVPTVLAGCLLPQPDTPPVGAPRSTGVTTGLPASTGTAIAPTTPTPAAASKAPSATPAATPEATPAATTAASPAADAGATGTP